jgi:hypothetical protein
MSPSRSRGRPVRHLLIRSPEVSGRGITVPLSRLELQRINQLEEQLEILYDKRHTFETGIATSASTNEKFELQQRLKREILPSLSNAERAYAQLLAGAVEPAQLPEPEAQALVEDVRVALVSHTRATAGEQSEELRHLLTDIRA